MTIRGDMEVMIRNRLLGRTLSDAAIRPIVTDILDWLVSADVLVHLESEGVSASEWCYGVSALHRKIAP